LTGPLRREWIVQGANEEKERFMAEGVELIQAFYDEMLGKGNLDAIDEYVTDDVVDHEQGLPGQPEGKEGVIFFVNALRGAFSDMKATVGPSLESGDLACARVTFTGKHTGEWMGVPATDKSFEITSIDIIRIEDGKCAEHWGVTDNIALIQQIGAIPEPASA
jgi:steroid delta-isomerase-like uncharacterized protein